MRLHPSLQVLKLNLLLHHLKFMFTLPLCLAFLMCHSSNLDIMLDLMFDLLMLSHLPLLEFDNLDALRMIIGSEILDMLKHGLPLLATPS